MKISFNLDGTGSMESELMGISVDTPMKYKLINSDTLELTVLTPTGEEEITRAKFRFFSNNSLILEISGNKLTFNKN